MSIKVVFATESTATGGGRDGHVRSATGRVDLDTRPPRELGGDGEGTNPEELFSAGYAACFLGALRLVARRSAVALDDESNVTVQVALGKDVATEEFGLTGTIIGNLPGLSQAIADDLMAQAHEVCPYSRATRGNADFIVSAKV
ncbi:organic hydroperoxide resistance protein [Mycolicibacter algericus]|uniref:Organic hydroperoxide resistance protein n=2 Tax=Mycolicibacter algericus TaxID=1288388 RepID=A0A7I9YEM2_MYCAL|nr:organic hydroperoxide resistance protein [Mycolicibacter algericus]OQZ95328.1 organic hydroperoxide resistance protein [Mycolicibacter algericus DSM 45454]GFG86982.1 organic hydroperoxide resistance protein [Mycolicibacter algericus]